MKVNTYSVTLAAFAAVLLVACSPSTPEPTTSAAAAATALPEAPAPAPIEAPAGRYEVDRNHATLGFSVSHLGFSNYHGRFTDYSISVLLDPEQISNSSVTVSIAADSISTDYTGDYKATHQKSPFDSWNEDLAKSEKFFNADQHTRIEFKSSKISRAANGDLKIKGELSLLGVTKPLTLTAKLVGSGQHPFRGVGAMGWSASGSFMRSEFGMTHLVEPQIVGDEVTLVFDGEFLQQVEADDS